MGTRDVYQKAMVIACITAGDEAELAKQLDLPLGDAVDYLLGNRPVPNDVFLRAVDIVMKRHRQQVYDVKVFLEEIRRRHPQR